MRELVPGLLQWSVIHPHIRKRVSSYLHLGSRAAIDPLLPEEGIEALESDERRPAVVLLTNRHHLRHGARLAERFGCPIRCHRAGLHEFAGGPAVEPFDPGDVLEGGVEVHGVGAICPDEAALHLPDVEALACADGVVRWEWDDPLGFVPDYLLGDDPEGVKDGLAAAYGRLTRLPFRHLLLAHGEPITGTGRDALRRFAAGRALR
jgi:hypothetical protein